MTVTVPTARAGRTAGPPVTATEVVLPGIVEPAGLQLRRRVLPPPAAGQVIVAVEATGISFAEQSMRRGRYVGQPRFPFVPGYDLVGTVAALGDGVDPGLLGQRVAALTKTGGWASHALLAARDLVPVPAAPDSAALDPAEVETLVVNGLTAWQLLHRTAKVRPGQTILVLGANGGVGTTLAALARHHGVRVIGTANPRHHEALRELGVLPLDHADPDLAARVRDLAPRGVDAVFDHLGGDSIDRSWSLLAPRGTLVCYAMASGLKDTGSVVIPFLSVLLRLGWWNALPNGHRATFYNVWAGHLARPGRFRRRLRRDLTTVFGLLAGGVLAPQVAARLPLGQIREAMELAESRTVYGKVVLVP